jgi:hypothetical protein
MAKILKPEVHGVLDYGLALFFLLAPSVFGFPDNAATLSYVVGVAYLGTSLLTRYPLGVWKLIPFPIHGVLETMMAIGWIAFPWLFGFANHGPARNFFIIAGVALLGVVAITDYKSKVQTSGSRMRHA